MARAEAIAKEGSSAASWPADGSGGPGWVCTVAASPKIVGWRGAGTAARAWSPAGWRNRLWICWGGIGSTLGLHGAGLRRELADETLPSLQGLGWRGGQSSEDRWMLNAGFFRAEWGWVLRSSET